jgi:hypothetical protein
VRDHKPERRAIRVIEAPKTGHRTRDAHAWRRDTKSEISRTQSGVMEHKSEIMQQSAPAVPSRATPRGEPVRPRSGQRVRFGVHPGASAVAQPPRVQRDARIHRETAPRRMMAPPAARAAPVARPAPHVATQPARHQPNRGAVSWSQRASNPAKAEPRAQARDNAPSRAHFGRR